MSTEEEIIKAMRGLPLSIQITPKDGRYLWQCIEGKGSAPSLASALAAAVSYLTGRLAGDVTVIEDLRGRRN